MRSSLPATRYGRFAPVATPAPRLPAPAAILFDLDGTLVDTMGPFADIAADVMATFYGLAPTNARRLYRQTSGVPFCQQLEIIFGEHELNAQASDEFERRKHVHAEAATMDDATRAALEELRERGLDLVVSSSGMQEHVDRFAERTPGLFTIALGFSTGLVKGEPHVRAVSELLGIPRSRLLYVGDSLRDAELAREAGVPFVGRVGTFGRDAFQRRFPGAPLVDSIDEIPRLFGPREGVTE